MFQDLRMCLIAPVSESAIDLRTAQGEIGEVLAHYDRLLDKWSS